MRRLLAPEVIQTSGTDCGPACLKSLLDGFGLPVSYDGLRDACHTDVDGTSIDVLEELAKDLGLDAEQVIVPEDHALLGESAALPAIAVVRNPDDTVHFVVAWRRCGPFVQVMDPARGRVWMPIQRYLDRLIVHSTVAPTAEWREWAGTDAFLRPLASRLRAAGLTAQQARERIVAAAADPGYLGLATLDAAARMLTSLRAANAVSRKDAAGVLGGLVSTADDSDAVSQIPEHYWSVRPASAPADRSEHLRVRGVVLVAIRGRRPQEHRAALTIAGSPRPHPLREVLSILHASGPLAAVILAIALLVVTAGVVFEAVLFRGLLDAASLLRIPEQGLSAGALLVTFAGSLLGVELLLAALERRAGRQVDARLRLAFLQKIPRLSPSYFQSRPVSDTIERSHSLQTVRQLPTLGIRALRVSLELAVTTAALVWLNPQVAVIAVLSAAAAAAIPLLGQPIIAERDLRVRTHVGALARFHLDAILGRKAIDAHGTAAVIERQHDSLLLDWATASLALQRASVTIEGLQMIVGVALAGWMVAFHTAGDASGLVLLQLYWMLNVPALGYELALHAREYPQHRSTLYRLLEPLQAPGARTFDEQPANEADAGRPSGLEIDIQQVTVRASGNTLLANVDLSIAAGTHVAVVGASGAGKSTLMGLLLGLHRRKPARC
jgi:ATP-binding cassette subfamily B protein